MEEVEVIRFTVYGEPQGKEDRALLRVITQQRRSLLDRHIPLKRRLCMRI